MTKKKSTPKVWYKKYIIAAARKCWRWSKVRREALKVADGKCAKCGGIFNTVNVDHIIPVLAGQTWPGWDTYLERLLMAQLGDLQVLCVPCHKIKTLSERRKK